MKNIKMLTLILWPSWLVLSLIYGCADPEISLDGPEELRLQVSNIERGRYVVEVMGCNDCHTPGYSGQIESVPERDWLVGSEVGFKGPQGTVYPTNLRLLVDSISVDEWVALARKMRQESPMADVMLPETAEQDLRAIYSFIRYLGPRGVPAPGPLAKGITPKTPYINYPSPH